MLVATRTLWFVGPIRVKKLKVLWFTRPHAMDIFPVVGSNLMATTFPAVPSNEYMRLFAVSPDGLDGLKLTCPFSRHRANSSNFARVSL